ncbi:hypothetical protein DMA12_12460 [Amycolatopsis balhimycina DSM 5908]|uniref:MucB/RseB N-terminal domain-containing protein n=1 Tax=Amycolatopsis balhimycina DSM 5908 TaxID=1081091 RepID=A0A428WSP8_AMYBA|nr:hypothetical protein [Amycolatopsis balhimycina]RSM46089.1 hypothetical protein DMA12_12460 [Amycolatopsis balhimycina DSM 5908]
MTPSVVRHEKRRRWAVAAAAAVVLVSAPSVVAALAPAGAAADPARLRALVLDSAGRPYQGYAESTGSLALPELPNLGSVTALFSMKTPMRAWYAGPDRYRVDILGTAGEHDVYRLPDGEYTWDYGDNTLTELIGEPAVRLPRAGDLLPPELARRILRAAGNDRVSALPGRNVAGVAASGLRLVPADPDTTIGQVDVWADPATGVAVRVELTARGQRAPIFVTEFRELAQTTPVVEAPRPALGSGFTVASAPDVASVLGAMGEVPLPAKLAGRPVTSPGFGGIEGAALYGNGLASFAVIAVPRTVAAAAGDAAGKAGGTQVKLAAGTVVQLSITPLSLAIVRSAVSRRSYLLAGTVTPDVLKSVADELSRLRRSGR